MLTEIYILKILLYLFQIYLGLRRSVDPEIWEMVQKKELGIFLSEIADIIFKKQLAYSCLEKEKVKNNVDKPIKMCNPKKVELFLSK